MVKEIFKRRPRFIPGRHEEHAEERVVPHDIWIPCARCHDLLYAKEFEDNLKVCPKCSYHAQLTAPERIATLLDEGSFEELDVEMHSLDPLQFRSPDRVYADKLAADRVKTGIAEALIYGRGRLEGIPVVVAVHNFSFRAGTMGVVVGEKVARAIELAAEERTPLIIVSASGGARMEEGVFSLMQMAKTTAALSRLSESRTPYISLLTDPTIGGVPASYAMLGDVNIAEPGAHIHFAGGRVVEGTTRQKGTADQPTAEFLLRHGMVDMVIPRSDLRATIARLLRLYAKGASTAGAPAYGATESVSAPPEALIVRANGDAPHGVAAAAKLATSRLGRRAQRNGSK